MGLHINNEWLKIKWPCVCVCVCVCVWVAQLCLTLCDRMDCSPPGPSIRGILQARILEWVAVPFPRGSSWPRDRIWACIWTKIIIYSKRCTFPQVSCIAGRFFTTWLTRKAQNDHRILNNQNNLMKLSEWNWLRWSVWFVDLYILLIPFSPPSHWLR